MPSSFLSSFPAMVLVAALWGCTDPLMKNGEHHGTRLHPAATQYLRRPVVNRRPAGSEEAMGKRKAPKHGWTGPLGLIADFFYLLLEWKVGAFAHGGASGVH